MQQKNFNNSISKVLTPNKEEKKQQQNILFQQMQSQNITSQQHLYNQDRHLSEDFRYNFQIYKSGTPLTYEVFSEYVANLQETIKKLEQRIESNESSIRIQDELIKLRNQPEQKNGNIQIIEKICQDQTNIQELGNQIKDLIAKMEFIDKKVKNIEEKLAKALKESEAQIANFTKRVSAQFEKFLKLSKQKFEEIFEKENEMKSTYQKYSEQIGILNQQIIVQKEDFHVIKQDIYQSLKQLSENYLIIEKNNDQINQDIKNFKPIIRAVEDDLLQLMKKNKDIMIAIQNIETNQNYQNINNDYESKQQSVKKPLDQLYQEDYIFRQSY